MTDRELLELAAKAAGFGAPGTGWVTWTESEYPRGSGLHGALWNGNGHCSTAELWNPLTDDGDALRLAVKLKLDITFYGNDSVGAQASHLIPEIQGDFVPLDDGRNDFATTRLAIVRAAAEIGGSIP